MEFETAIFQPMLRIFAYFIRQRGDKLGIFDGKPSDEWKKEHTSYMAVW
jgi:hypothetical protein